MIKHDYHMHTNHSTDSDAKMEDMIIAAIDKGLEEIALTDHVDFIFDHTVDYDKYILEFNELREKYAKKIEIILGVEEGLGIKSNEQNKILADSYPFDFIIGSSHDIEGLDLYNRDYFVNKTKDHAYTNYFKEMIHNVKTYKDFCAYGHLDYIMRYGTYENNELRYKDYSDLIDEFFKLLIENGKGIELNTSGFRYGFNTTHPSLDFVKRYLELGGEIFTVGSDAHTPEVIGTHFDYVKDVLENLGVKYICKFRERKPIFVKF